MELRVAGVEDRCATIEGDLATDTVQCAGENGKMQHSAEERLAVALNGHNSMANDIFVVVQDSIRDLDTRIKHLELRVTELREQVAELEDEEAECSRLLECASESSQDSKSSQEEQDTNEVCGEYCSDVLKSLKKLTTEVELMSSSLAACQSSLRFQSNFADHCHIKLVALTLVLLGGDVPDLNS